MENITKTFGYLVDTNNIKQKDLVFLMAHALSKHNSTTKKERKIYANELLALIKEKEFDYYKEDKMGDILLTLSFGPESFEMTKYLLENKYNLSRYNKKVSKSLCKHICSPDNPKVFKYFLKRKDISEKYKNDIVIHTYKIISLLKTYGIRDNDTSLDYHYNCAQIVMKADVNFNDLIKKVLETEFKAGSVENFLHCLKTHPLDPYVKINMLDSLVGTEIVDKKEEAYHKWSIFYKL